MNIVSKARAFAIEAHKDTKYGDLPYEYHLKAVVSEVKIAAHSMLLPDDIELLIASAWLHDVVEDTDVTLHDIREEFGGRVARIVDCVTDEPGKNRKERKAKTYVKLEKGPLYARTVKLADRLANMKASIENPGLASMYRKEFPEFIKRVGFDEENKSLVMELFWLYIDSQLAVEEK